MTAAARLDCPAARVATGDGLSRGLSLRNGREAGSGRATGRRPDRPVGQSAAHDVTLQCLSEGRDALLPRHGDPAQIASGWRRGQVDGRHRTGAGEGRPRGEPAPGARAQGAPRSRERGPAARDPRGGRVRGDRGSEPVARGAPPPGPAGGRDGRAGAGARRDRDGQGPRGARRPRPQPPPRPAARHRELRGPARGAHRERALRLREGGLHRRHRPHARAASRWRTGARSSSTRSASCRSRCRPSCCACCRPASSSGSAPSKTLRADVRLIAATNRDLEREVREGRFRADLFYRLSVFPPHASRPCGTVRTTSRCWSGTSSHASRPAWGATSSACPTALMRAFRAYAWPGNIRELENVVERALILSTGTYPGDRPALLGRAPRRLHPAQRPAVRRRPPAHPRRARAVRLEGRRQGQRRRAAGPQSQHAPVPDEEARDHTAGPGELDRLTPPRRRGR